MPLYFGFARMRKEPGAKRVFLPEFVQFLADLGPTVCIEQSCGSRSGYSFDDYRQGYEAVHLCRRPQAFQQDLVLVLRSPLREEFGLMCPGATLYRGRRRA